MLLVALFVYSLGAVVVAASVAAEVRGQVGLTALGKVATVLALAVVWPVRGVRS